MKSKLVLGYLCVCTYFFTHTMENNTPKDVFLILKEMKNTKELQLESIKNLSKYASKYMHKVVEDLSLQMYNATQEFFRDLINFALDGKTLKEQKEYLELMSESLGSIQDVITLHDKRESFGLLARIVSLNNKKLIQWLLDQRIPQEKRNEALFHTKNPKIATLLFEYGANPNAQDSITGNTPLHVATKFGRKKMIQVLIDNHARVNLPNKEGIMPIVVAPTSRITRLLLDKQAGLLCRDRMGNSIIHNLIINPGVKEKQLKRIIKLYVQHGGELRIRNTDHKTPRELAKELSENFGGSYQKKMKKIVPYLEKYEKYHDPKKQRSFMFWLRAVFFMLNFFK